MNEVEEYLARVPEPARGTLAAVRAMIRAAAPAAATEGLSYGMPAFRYKGRWWVMRHSRSTVPSSR